MRGRLAPPRRTFPALRQAVGDAIVKHFARQNGVLGVAIFIPGADFPVLTLNQIRMVLRLAAAHGEELDRERAFEVLSVIAAGLGFRTVARHLVGARPGLRLGGQGRHRVRRDLRGRRGGHRLLCSGWHEGDRAVRPVPVLAFPRMEREERYEALLIEEADAWFEYLEATQAEAATGRYDEVEPWAWARLNQRLRAVERKRRAQPRRPRSRGGCYAEADAHGRSSPEWGSRRSGAEIT